MKAIIYPSIAKGSIEVPSSKSYAHRYIIASCLAKGVSIIKNYDKCIDTLSTIEAFLPFGVKYEINGKELLIDSSNFHNVDSVTIDCKQSASTIRFLIPLLINYASNLKFIGDKILLSRPMDEYIKLFGNNIKISGSEIIVNKALDLDTIYIDGSISSQFISGIIFNQVIKDYPSTVIIQGKVVSSNYIDLTIDALNQFGANIKRDDNVIYIIPSKIKPRIIEIEGDYTQAANFIVLDKINSHIEIKGLNKDSKQSDKLIYELLDQDEIDLSNSIDLGPILFAYASTFPKTTKFVNTNRLVMKESNRVLAMVEGLKQFGIEAVIKNNICYITGKKDLIPNGEIDSFNDHRVCMALAILASIAKDKVIINGAECVNKSYPNFFNDLALLGIKIELK
ncbi:MAG: hypothetical protein J5691_05410 [Bacilli bacterium]|nr:hypothetical protein [Bacilli bacterium]